jgi:hypothetical protein
MPTPFYPPTSRRKNSISVASAIKRKDPPPFTFSNPPCGYKSFAGQLLEAPLRLSQRFEIVSVELMARVAGVIHYNLGRHKTLLDVGLAT